MRARFHVYAPPGNFNCEIYFTAERVAAVRPIIELVNRVWYRCPAKVD